MIKFSPGAREFRGGFATVSQGLLASSSRAEEVANGSEHTTEDRADLDAHNLLYPNGIEKPEDDQQSRGERVHSHGAGDSDDNSTKEEERTGYDDEGDQKSRIQPSITKVGDELASSDHTADGDPDSGDRNPRPHNGIQAPKDDQQGHDEPTDSHIADGGNRQSQEEARVESESTNKEQDPDRQTSKPKVCGSAAKLCKP